MIAVFCAWAGLLALYLVFAGQASPDELVSGALCAAAATVWWVGILRASDHSFAFDAAAWRTAGRAWRKLPPATLSVAVILLRNLALPVTGEVAHRFFSHGRRTDPADGGRRAVAVLFASLAPDSIVLRTPVERDEIVVHGLFRSEPPKDPRWPI